MAGNGKRQAAEQEPALPKSHTADRSPAAKRQVVAGQPPAAKRRPTAGRRGPRPTEVAWREKILAAAVHEFSQRSYQETTVRRIAQTAGVDAKLVHYYFGTKDELFSAMAEETVRSRGFVQLLFEAADDPTAEAGVQYLTALLTAVEHDEVGRAFLGLIRNLGTHEESRRIFLRFVTGNLMAQVVPQLQNSLPETRVALVGSQVFGLVFARYILQIPPLAQLSIPEVARTVGPTLSRYLVADLPLTEA